jgi:hypothetical protein
MPNPKQHASEILTPEFCGLMDRIRESGLECEIIAEALMEMARCPDASPLLCLQIAAYDWDVL